MDTRIKNNGSALLMVIFIVALLAAVVMGMLKINTDEIQIMSNQIFAAQALAIAEAGLNDAFYELRIDDEWNDGFTDKTFTDGSYTVTVDGQNPNLTIYSVGKSSHGFICSVVTDIKIGTSSPYVISIDAYRTNEGQ